MSRMDNDGPPEEVATETTSPFRDDFLGELDAAAPASAGAAMWDEKFHAPPDDQRGRYPTACSGANSRSVSAFCGPRHLRSLR